MENYDNSFGPMDANFAALYDAAQEARAQIAEAIKTSDAQVICGTQFCQLHVGDNVNFYAHIVYAFSAGRPEIVDRATADDSRDCTVQEIRNCAARVIYVMRQSTRRARIERLKAELKAEVAILEAEEGADNGK